MLSTVECLRDERLTEYPIGEQCILLGRLILHIISIWPLGGCFSEYFGDTRQFDNLSHEPSITWINNIGIKKVARRQPAKLSLFKINLWSIIANIENLGDAVRIGQLVGTGSFYFRLYFCDFHRWKWAEATNINIGLFVFTFLQITSPLRGADKIIMVLSLPSSGQTTYAGPDQHLNKIGEEESPQSRLYGQGGKGRDPHPVPKEGTR